MRKKDRIGGENMQHFFVNRTQVQENTIMIEGSDVNHIKNVLRMKIGENLEIHDNESNKYIGHIDTMTEDFIKVYIEEVSTTNSELESKIYLFQGIPKGDKMELIIQKSVELGVYEIIPVETKRCVVKIDAKKADKKIERWNKIAESAAKQAVRGVIPCVTNILSFQSALEYGKNLDVLIIPYEKSEGMTFTKELIKNIVPGQSIGVYIGPEGGFEAEEIQAAEEVGVIPVTLGKRILRTETAGMTTLSVLMFHLEK